MEQETASPLPGSRAELRRHIEETSGRSPLAEPRVRYWRTAERITLFALLAYAGLQYYFFDVFLVIMALPSVSVFPVLP